MKNSLLELKDILNTILPKGKHEFILFFAFFFFYAVYGVLFQLNSCVIDWPFNIRTDMYLYLDTNAYYQRGYSLVSGHPYLIFFSKPFIFIGDIFINVFGYKSKGILLVLICVCLVSSSIVYVFRYLRRFVMLDLRKSYLLCVFYGLFSTNLILSFTPESFTVSIWLLMLMVYYYSYRIATEQRISLLACATFSFLAGGVTITNLGKGVLPVFLSKQDSFKIRFIKASLVSGLFITSLVLLNLKYDIFGRAAAHFSFHGTTHVSFYTAIRQVLENTIASPLFFTKFIKKDLFPPNIDLAYFQTWWQYIPLVAFMSIGLISLILNRRNILIHIICAVLLTDFLLHVVLLFGASEGFIYGGHWVFVVPLLVGWLYKSIKSKIMEKLLTLTIIVLTLFLFINNGVWMSDFYNHIIANFPSQLP